MQLSNTTAQSGLVQRVERYTRRPYGSSGDELREIINDLNAAFEDIMPLLLSYTDHIRWDDPNHTDAPIGYIDINSGQNDYKLGEDDNNLDILNLVGVRMKESATAEYKDLDKMTISDERALEMMSPQNSGIPKYYLERGPFLYIGPLKPDFNVTSGIELFFEREQNYFTVTGTSGNDTTEPGIPKPFHELVALHAAQRWNMVNRSDDTALLQSVGGMILRKERQLEDSISLRNPTKTRMSTSYEGGRGDHRRITDSNK